MLSMDSDEAQLLCSRRSLSVLVEDPLCCDEAAIDLSWRRNNIVLFVYLYYLFPPPRPEGGLGRVSGMGWWG